MKILVYRWDIYPYDNIIKTLKKQGHLVDVLAFPISNHISDSSFTPILEEKLRENAYDLVFSVNFYAVIAGTCFRENIHYAAWTCDTPLLLLPIMFLRLPIFGRTAAVLPPVHPDYYSHENQAQPD